MTFDQHGLSVGGLSAENDREFHCPYRRARCTEYPINGPEFGHRDGSPRRPEHLSTGQDGATYEHVRGDKLATDGGEER